MADLLPSIPDASAREDAEPRVVGLDDEDAEAVLGALSSTTARELLAALNDDPGHPSALADRVDTSLQNVQYHLGKLEDAGVVEVVDTAYSEKGREMDVYAPADRPLVLFAGREEDETLLQRALGRLLGGVGALAGLSLAVRGLVDANETSAATGAAAVDTTSGSTSSEGSGAEVTTSTDDSAADYSLDGQATGTDQQTDAATDLQQGGDQAVEPLAQEFGWIAEPLDVSGIPPELVVFLAGSCLLAIGVGTWYWRKRQTRV
ncbi:ArsR/SmtB family transcription factor [Salinarchaeum laminariae]|uniref:ArsR/SmtB family transcription factor n=1 Tax=Salinarchaeum laminariae TaxID=869888 RepID=UPI0020C07286|nr:winged helix-turn-helix domain-containing protein [Salinarchaeum laminariae]